MINEKNVIIMKIPYPMINGGLALKPHIYICKKSQSTNHEFIKCQTLKPYMLTSNIMQHYWDENPDIRRNPFQHKTRIDCDKIFSTHTVTYDPRLKTTTRPDVCDALYQSVQNELYQDGYENIALNEDELKQLNSLIR